MQTHQRLLPIHHISAAEQVRWWPEVSDSGKLVITSHLTCLDNQSVCSLASCLGHLLAVVSAYSSSSTDNTVVSEHTISITKAVSFRTN